MGKYNYALNNYDASKYDASRFDDGQPGMDLSQVTITIVNNIAATQTVELFNAFRSFSKILNNNVSVSLPIAAWPNDTVDGVTGLPLTVSRVYWNQTGDLVIESAAGTRCTISCDTVPYRTLFEGSAVLPFMIKQMRYSFQNDPQLNKEIVANTNTIFGKETKNKISPKAYLDPNQLQTKVVDIPVSISVNGETAIFHDVIAGETVSICLFINVQTVAGV